MIPDSGLLFGRPCVFSLTVTACCLVVVLGLGLDLVTGCLPTRVCTTFRCHCVVPGLLKLEGTVFSLDWCFKVSLCDDADRSYRLFESRCPIADNLWLLWPFCEKTPIAVCRRHNINQLLPDKAAITHLLEYRVAKKSKPLSIIIRLEFSPILIIKSAQEYYIFVLNTLCMT